MDLVKTFEQTQIKREIPDIRLGDTIRIHEKIKEKDKERIQVFEGVLIRKRGSGINITFTMRKIAAGGIGVERILPLYLPALAKIEVLKRGKVRRAKLYYLRKKQEREARLKEKKLTAEELEQLKYEEKVDKKEKPKKAKEKREEKKEEPRVKVKKEEKKVEARVRPGSDSPTEESESAVDQTNTEVGAGEKVK